MRSEIFSGFELLLVKVSRAMYVDTALMVSPAKPTSCRELFFKEKHWFGQSYYVKEPDAFRY